ncbi:helix-turn-helix transcriptional regulator [Mycobacterium kyogaense]|uniref:helix-turn-helix transcriptional regulator n=1 Tax=Mycobacterium kyogaense TaxID=2212479 RepID=UPI0013C4071C|nr:helix-turn-helix transcriptional regulator [Mycobacterium kyogaense]
MGDIVLCLVRSGSLRHAHPGGMGHACHRGTATAIGWQAEAPIAGDIHRGHFDVVTVDRGLLGAVASTAPGLGSSPEPVKLVGGMPVSPVANKLMADTLHHLFHDVAPSSDAAASQLMVGSVARHLAATMIAAFPSNALLEPTIEDRHDSTPALLRRALAYIDDHAQTDITVADIANHIFVTTRALQYMFRRHRDCTPIEYLRRVRLHNAHLDLVAANRGVTTVSTVARQWGFFHTGRFAMYYRQHYGRTPRQTLCS